MRTPGHSSSVIRFYEGADRVNGHAENNCNHSYGGCLPPMESFNITKNVDIDLSNTHCRNNASMVDERIQLAKDDIMVFMMFVVFVGLIIVVLQNNAQGKKFKELLDVALNMQDLESPAVTHTPF